MDSHEEKHERVIEEEDGDGGWVDTHHYAGKELLFANCCCINTEMV